MLWNINGMTTEVKTWPLLVSLKEESHTHTHVRTYTRQEQKLTTNVQQQVACVYIGYAVSFPGVKRLERALTNHHHLAPRLRMSTIITLLLLCTSYDVLWDVWPLPLDSLSHKIGQGSNDATKKWIFDVNWHQSSKLCTSFRRNIHTYLRHCSIPGIGVACAVTDLLKNLPNMVLNEEFHLLGTLKRNPEGTLAFLSLDIKWL